MHRLLALLILPLFSLLLSLPSSAKTSGGTGTSTVHTATTHTDAQIQATIQAKLAKSKIGKDGFTSTCSMG